MKIEEWKQDDYLISTDKDKLNLSAIHRYLTTSTWAAGIDEQTVFTALQNSLNFGVYGAGSQIGFARMVTDYATFAYLCDVYIVDEYQGKGLGRWLIQCCQSHPVADSLRRMLLFTSTAPWLYEKFGYQPVNRPNYAWAITRHDIYRAPE